MMISHDWPSDEDHLWTKWMAYAGPPEAKEYRVCVHPQCHGFEVRPTPKA